jgi:simple sugar transport system ATP-binding protein
LKTQGIAVIFVSHKLDEVFAVCDRIAVLRNGEKVIDEAVEKFPRDKLVYYMTGKQIDEKPYTYQATSVEPLLEVVDISRPGSFEHVSFAVHPGEILAIAGQLGSGRTELATSLFGITRIRSGIVRIRGVEKQIKTRKDALKNGIAYLPEDRLSEGLFLNRSLGDNFASAVIDKMKNRFGIVREDKLSSLSDHWMNELNMSIKPYTTPAHNFSGGNQQRIVLGKWLAAEPKIFILNCPTVGVDVKSKSEIHTIMKDLATKGLAIIMISDDIGEILSTSNRVIVMNAGRMTDMGDTAAITHQNLSERIIATQ